MSSISTVPGKRDTWAWRDVSLMKGSYSSSEDLSLVSSSHIWLTDTVTTTLGDPTFFFGFYRHLQLTLSLFLSSPPSFKKGINRIQVGCYHSVSGSWSRAEQTLHNSRPFPLSPALLHCQNHFLSTFSLLDSIVRHLISVHTE